jgi:hypothetical protein
MTRLSAFAAGLSGEIAIARKAAVLIGYVLATLTAGFRCQ